MYQQYSSRMGYFMDNGILYSSENERTVAMCNTMSASQAVKQMKNHKNTFNVIPQSEILLYYLGVYTDDKEKKSDYYKAKGW